MGHPVFEVTQSWDDGAKKLTLNVKQTQKIDPLNLYPQVEYFQAKVDVEIDGRVEQVWIKPQAENTFTFDAAAKPQLVNFDYEGALIKELKFDKSTDELLYQFKNDKDVLGRVWAMNQLIPRYRSKDANDGDKAKILAAMNQAITGETVWMIRRDAIQAIAQPPQGNPNAPNAAPANFDAATVTALTAATKDANSNVRAAAITGLGFLRDAKYAETFLAALNDRSYGVIDAAAISLGRTKDARSFEALAKLAETASWKDRVRIAGLQGLASLGDKRAVDLGFKYTDKSYAGNVRSTALNVLAASGKGDARIYPLLLENFKKSLEANSFQGIFNGLQAFISLGDPRGQEAFDLAREKFKTNQNILGAVNQLEGQFKKAVEQK
jgi:aminopeptidase N